MSNFKNLLEDILPKFPERERLIAALVKRDNEQRKQITYLEAKMQLLIELQRDYKREAIRASRLRLEILPQ